jgi:hypothetical protein
MRYKLLVTVNYLNGTEKDIIHDHLTERELGDILFTYIANPKSRSWVFVISRIINE